MADKITTDGYYGESVNVDGKCWQFTGTDRGTATHTNLEGNASFSTCSECLTGILGTDGCVTNFHSLGSSSIGRYADDVKNTFASVRSIITNPSSSLTATNIAQVRHNSGETLISRHFVSRDLSSISVSDTITVSFSNVLGTDPFYFVYTTVDPTIHTNPVYDMHNWTVLGFFESSFGQYPSGLLDASNLPRAMVWWGVVHARDFNNSGIATDDFIGAERVGLASMFNCV